MLLKKTIILSNKHEKYSNAIALVGVQKEKSGSVITLKCYNLQHFDSLMFGFSEKNRQVLKREINPRKQEHQFKVGDVIDLEGDLGCVLVDSSSGENIPVLWGTDHSVDILFPSTTTYQNEKRDDDKKYSLHTDSVSERAHVSTVAKEELFEQPSNEELEELIDESIAKEQPESGHTFFDAISLQIEELFSKYPEELGLTQLIPNSKWVKVDYEGNGNVYVLGLVYEGDVLKYIAYGVPGASNAQVAGDIKDYSQWVPASLNNASGSGFWIMYQDAETGESINLSAGSN